MRSSYGLGVLCVLLASTLWGTTGASAALVPGVGPLAIAAASTGFGGFFQAAIATRGIRASRGDLLVQWRVVLVSAVMVAVFPLAFYSSMRLSGVAIGTVVTIGSAPPAAALVERLVDHAPLTRRWVVGTGLGIAGVVALSLADPSGRTGSSPVAGILLGLVAGFSYAFYSWGCARVIGSGIGSRTVMGATFGLGGLMLMPVLLVTGGPILESGRHLAVAAYLAIVPMFIGYVFFGMGLARVRASTATTISLVEPAVAAGIAVAFLGERLALLGWAGMAVLIASVLVTSVAGGSRYASLLRRSATRPAG